MKMEMRISMEREGVLAFPSSSAIERYPWQGDSKQRVEECGLNSGGGFGVCNPVLEQSPSHFGESKQGEDET
jgi:hypothetical protein